MSSIQKQQLNYFTKDNTRFVFLDGITCDTIDKVYSTLQLQLSIPDYFGNNLDALEEVLSDLEWINEEKIEIIILQSSALLVNDGAVKPVLIDILNSCEHPKVSIHYLQDPIIN
jgi:RNAse (barnase) inhibitor barstar